jgi:hypothetical protein
METTSKKIVARYMNIKLNQTLVKKLQAITAHEGVTQTKLVRRLLDGHYKKLIKKGIFKK